MAVNAEQWAKSVLAATGYPATQANEAFIESWLPRENTAALNNPMATTLYEPGATAFNTLPGGGHVWNYPTYQTGVTATASTIGETQHYPALEAALASGDPYTYANQAGLQANMMTWSGEGYSTVESSANPNYISPGLASSTASPATHPKAHTGKAKTSSDLTSSASSPGSAGASAAKKPGTTQTQQGINPITSWVDKVEGEHPFPTWGWSWLPWNWPADLFNGIWPEIVTWGLIALGVIVALYGLKKTLSREPGGGGGGGGGGENVTVQPTIERDVERAGEGAALAA